MNLSQACNIYAGSLEIFAASGEEKTIFFWEMPGQIQNMREWHKSLINNIVTSVSKKKAFWWGKKPVEKSWKSCSFFFIVFYQNNKSFG